MLDYKELAKLPEVIKELLVDENLKINWERMLIRLLKKILELDERIDAEILEVGALLLGRKDKRER